jgi:MYXO-CTERM domain-containing protein
MRFLSSFSASLIVLALGGTALATPRPMLYEGPFNVAAGKQSAVAQGASAAAFDATAREIIKATAPWSASLSLGASRAAVLSDGRRIVKMPQMHAGLPVANRGATVSFGPDGVARLAAVKLAEDLPGDVTPSVDAATAAIAATKAAQVEMDPKVAHLAIWDGANGPQLAWFFYARPQYALPYAPAVVVDAKTGEVIVRYNAAVSVHQAQVYPTNPVKSPSLTKVTLNLPSGATKLSNSLVVGQNCIDNHTLKNVQGLSVHTCDLIQTAIADGNQDFPQMPADDTAIEDPFAELHIFYHTNHVYEMFQGFQPGFKVQAAPIDTVANLRWPPGLPPADQFDPSKLSNPNLPLLPFQNAFFAPADPSFSALFGVDGAGMWFGQGPLKDYSYDADVIYHEFTHAAVDATVKFVGTPHRDQFGISMSPGGMNEGTADYFSSALAGDPDVGEYAVGDIDPGLKSIRSLTAPDACPTAIGGESHQDATLYSASLWDVRSKLADAQKKQFDLAVFSAMNAAPSGDISYEDFAQVIITQVKNSALGAAVAQQLTNAFTNRGILPQCTRVLGYTGVAMDGPLLIDTGSGGKLGVWFLPGTQSSGISSPLGYSPGVFQVHATFADTTDTLNIAFQAADTGGQGIKPKVVVRFGDEPIQFTWNPYATVGEVVAVNAQGGGQGLASYSATVPVPVGTKSAFVMIANSGTSDAILSGLEITAPSGPVGTASSSTSSSTSSSSTGSGAGVGGSTGTWGEGGEGGEGGTPPTAKSGCGCTVPGDSGGEMAGAFSLLAAIGAVFARRRRRG